MSTVISVLRALWSVLFWATSVCSLPLLVYAAGMEWISPQVATLATAAISVPVVQAFRLRSRTKRPTPAPAAVPKEKEHFFFLADGTRHEF